MKWLILSLVVSACAGGPFTSFGHTGDSSDTAGSGPFSTIPESSAGAGGSDDSLSGGVSGVAPMPPEITAGMPPSAQAGGGGAPGIEGQEGGTAGYGGFESTVSCDGVPVWTVGCESAEPMTSIVYDGQLWLSPEGPTTCNWRCPPEGASREADCDFTQWRYELVGPCES